MSHDHVAQGCSCQGTVYLLHFDRPYKHARHYLGWARKGRLEARLQEHRDGKGARLMAVIKEAGIGFELARTWPGPRTLERALKNCHNAPAKCPLCGVTPRPRRPSLGAGFDLAAPLGSAVALPTTSDIWPLTGASLALEPPF